MRTRHEQRPIEPRHVLAAALVLAAPFALTASASSQQPPKPTPAAASAEDSAARQKAARQQELDALRAEQKGSAELEARLKAEIDAIGEDRRKLNQTLIDTAGRVRAVETGIGAAEARLKTLDDNERLIRSSLVSRRAVLTEVLAALQRIGRRPPPAIMVSPEDALQSVRTAIMLGAVLPEMKLEAEKLVADLTELVRVRARIAAEREELARSLTSLSEDRRRMARLVEERQRRQSEAEKALEQERQRAVALAQKADNLKDLIAKLEQDVLAAARAAQAAAQAETKPPSGAANLAALKDPGRLAPAIAFASAKGTLSLPVNGVRLRQFGAQDGVGGIEKGISIASRTGAQVTAPCDGWVVYAGPFRSYGQLLILNAGGGYHILLAGMERISVDLGQFVLTGEPVAVMGGGPRLAAAVATGSSQPVLYVEFRKDGTPVDPSPWWATTESEKVRG